MNDFTFQFATFAGGTADSERGRFAQKQFGETIRIGRRTENCEENSRPILLHLDRSVENIERTLRESLFDHVPENFGVNVVEICFEDGDGVGFPIVR